jgi:predicted ATPase
MKATLEWSYKLLSEPEQILLNRLSIFEGSWTVEEVVAICASENKAESLDEAFIIEVLAQLVKKSLVVVEVELNWANQKAYHLFEIIKQYAGGKLSQTGEAFSFQCKHCEYYIAGVEQPVQAFSGSNSEWARNYLKFSFPNIQKALSWSFGGSEIEQASTQSGICENAKRATRSEFRKMAGKGGEAGGAGTITGIGKFCQGDKARPGSRESWANLGVQSRSGRRSG